MWSVRILSGVDAGQIFDLKLGKNIFGSADEGDPNDSDGTQKYHERKIMP